MKARDKLRYVSENFIVGKSVCNPPILELVKSSQQAESGGDFYAFLPHGFMVNEKVKETLSPLINNCGQWIPMKLGNETLFFFNITSLLDVLNDEQTEFETFEGFVVGIKKYVFINYDYSTYPVFRLQGNYGNFPIVTDRFKEFVEKQGLSGIKFKVL
ncbi:imm11 family protein [Pseudoalteromonas luteoviolacea]|uniref:imm11 family protein n=1 Tax=Pseudoalteromonas luteoviolacea TaxID=43657 RepID=UPI0012DA5BD8|nr:hypothetical protein [Pseudoalteromonas luteoviolacea]MBE0388660.1 hypothetical protein [Pseudoalteromonas luteoviolacea DSM 6061]